MDKTDLLEMEIELTEISKKWLQEHHHQGIVWECDTDKPFKLHSVAADFVELNYLDIPYRIPHMMNGQQTTKKVAS